jgi:hypothetical protein
MLAMELIPALRVRLRELEHRPEDAVASGRRAALWRVQQRAARIDGTLSDVRRYCLDSLAPRLLDEDDENDYLRGYREGFQAALEEIHALETRSQRA